MFDPWQDAVRPMGRIGHAIESHAAIPSTNDRARELLARTDADGHAIVAEQQTAGRGRRGRTWVSPPGVNLMVSVAIRPRIGATDAWQLGLAAALAAADACASVAPVVLKWPNDLVDRDGRKLGGLLIETIAEANELTGAIVGIGINVNWPRADMPEEIAESATSLSELAGATVDRVALLRRLLEALERELSLIEAGTSPLDRYRAACNTLGSRVSVRTPDGEVRGTATGLDATGSLVIAADDGVHVIATGEVVRVERTVAA